MGLFDKKFCDICGEKIGLLGNRKVEDGNVCKNCANKLSPFFSERRKSTLADIKAQLAYREENKAAVAAFRATRVMGTGKKVMIDENAGKFMVSDGKKITDENPDVIDLSRIRSCNYDVKEDKTELKQKDKDGKDVSYNPRRYRYRYFFYMNINVDHPWFDQIRYQLNTNTIEITDTGGIQLTAMGRRGDQQYDQCQALANEIVSALMQPGRPAAQNQPPAPAPAPAPEQPQQRTCQYCGTTSVSDGTGQCPGCGASY